MRGGPPGPAPRKLELETRASVGCELLAYRLELTATSAPLKHQYDAWTPLMFFLAIQGIMLRR